MKKFLALSGHKERDRALQKLSSTSLAGCNL